jgi:protein-arginine kinase activator protein McsA
MTDVICEVCQEDPARLTVTTRTKRGVLVHHVCDRCYEERVEAVKARFVEGITVVEELAP